MQKSLGLSLAAHVAVVAVGYVGLPYLLRPPPILDTPVIIEVVMVTEVTNAPPPAPPEPPKVEAPPPPPPPPPPKAEAPPPPPPEPEPEVAAVPPPESKPKPKPKPKPEAKPKPRPKAPPQLAAVKPQRKPKPPDPFASVLKTVEKLKRRPPAPRKKDDDKKKKAAKPESFEQRISRVLTTPALPHDATRPLTISEIDVVRQQIAGCWNLPAGAKEAEDLVIEIWVAMNPDGTVREARIQDQGRLRTDGFFRAAAESALRAVLNPRCSPLKLPRQRYEQWQTMTLSFNPREMFGT